MVRLKLLLLLLLFSATAASAQEPGPGPLGAGGQGPFGGRGRLGMPPRDNPQQATGTSRIVGRVVAADTGSPVRRAQIRVTSTESRFNRVVTTDGEGRYELLNLPAGRYRLFVNRAGFVALEYGQARPFESGKPLDLADGQAMEKVDFSLPRGSVITGRITDEFGDPMTDVQVQAMRYQFVNGERQLANAGRAAQTDDLGQYRIFGLMPGDYIVRASLRQNNGNQNEPDPVGYPGTYYPGVLDITQAQTVAVTLGQELSSVGFPLMPARLSRVSGTVMGSDGRPLTGGRVMLRPRGANNLAALRNAIGSSNQVRADGTFQLTNVPPGDYMLDVQQRPQNARNIQEVNLSELEFASVPLSVSGDIDGLTIVTTPGVTVSGRVVYQGGTPSQQSNNMQVTATPSTGGSSPLTMLVAARALGGGRVNADGAFELRGIAGPSVIRVQGAPSGWALKSVVIEGTDVTDKAFEFKPGNNISGAIITLTNRVTELSGSVRDGRGQPVADYVVVVFPEDNKLWGALSRYVQTSRPNQNGTFTIKALPPGRYVAAVVPSLENGTQNDPALLEQLRMGAETFSLADGQTLNLNLKMAAR